MRFALLMFFWCISSLVSAQNINGFDLSESSVPSNFIFPGGPPRDGIPAIDNPVFYPVAIPADSTRILGVHYNGISKAYPISIMNYHEIVNDTFDGAPVVVTYCPLCGSGVAFSREIAGQTLSFGVSGLLYNSDVLLYDRQTGSLWSQLLMQCISGKLRGTELRLVNTVSTSLTHWHQQYPETVVLSEETGHFRDYSKTPYAGYSASDDIYFPISSQSERFHPKELVLGIEVDGKFKCYPFSKLERSHSIQDSFRKKSFTITYDKMSRTAQVLENEKVYPSIVAYWFAWYAFHPTTKVY